MRALILPILLIASGCQQGVSSSTGTDASADGFTAITADETVIFGGTEPFWGGKVKGTMLTYTTPEDIEGADIPIEKFIGLGGISYSGELKGESFDLLVTAGECSDGMSDRLYPYTATLQIGLEQRQGCAHTDLQPYSGPDSQ